MTSTTKKKAKAEPWWKNELGSMEKMNVKRAFVDYVLDNDLLGKIIPKTMPTYKAVLPYLALLEPKWKAVSAEDINIDKYLAHKAYTSTLRNLISFTHDLDNLIQEEQTRRNQLNLASDDENDGDIDQDASQQLFQESPQKSLTKPYTPAFNTDDTEQESANSSLEN